MRFSQFIILCVKLAVMFYGLFYFTSLFIESSDRISILSHEREKICGKPMLYFNYHNISHCDIPSDCAPHSVASWFYYVICFSYTLCLAAVILISTITIIDMFTGVFQIRISILWIIATILGLVLFTPLFIALADHITNLKYARQRICGESHNMSDCWISPDCASHLAAPWSDYIIGFSYSVFSWFVVFIILMPYQKVAKPNKFRMRITPCSVYTAILLVMGLWIFIDLFTLQDMVLEYIQLQRNCDGVECVILAKAPFNNVVNFDITMIIFSILLLLFVRYEN